MEVSTMENSGAEALTHELPATDGSDMEVNIVEDEKPITPQMDELPGATCLIMGGGDEAEKIVETYDVNKKSFKPRKSTLYERYGSTSVKINNHVYSAGGLDSNFVECLDLNQDDADWKKVPSMNEKRLFAASAVLYEQMCVAGGMNKDEYILSSVELYDPVVACTRLVDTMV
ncbi:kelch domain-containing protein 8A-like [Ciona intestinalis]